jgi:hypothetical protein
MCNVIQIWARAAAYMGAGTTTTDPVMLDLKDKAQKKGKALIDKEFGVYQNKGKIKGDIYIYVRSIN